VRPFAGLDRNWWIITTVLEVGGNNVLIDVNTLDGTGFELHDYLL